MSKVYSFLEEVVREVHPTRGRVVWPSQEKVIKSTWVVIIMSLLSGLFLWAADFSFGEVVSSILFDG